MGHNNLIEQFPFAFVVDDDPSPFELTFGDEEPRYASVMREARQWCADNIGPEGPGARWAFDQDVIYLADQHDAFAFKIRWG